MPSTNAEQIVAVLASRLQAITTGGGYNNTANVYPDRSAIDTDQGGDLLPGLVLREDQETVERITLGGAPKHRCRLQVSIELYTRAGLAGLVGDVKKALFLAGAQDLGLGAGGLESVGWERVENPTGVDCITAELVCVVEYSERYGDPYVFG